MSALKGYTTCRIQFIPHNQRDAHLDYSDRSSVELREHDVSNITLRALDIEHNKQEIFDIPLTREQQYKKGNSGDIPDEIRSDNGTYRLWPKGDSRVTFHKDLTRCYEQLSLFSTPDSGTDESRPSSSAGFHEQPSYINDDDDDDVPVSVFNNQNNPPVVSPKSLLTDVHRLSTCIEQGDAAAATRLISELIAKGVRLQAKSGETDRDEKQFTIQVQIDGNEYGVGQQGAKIPVDVYQSTTIRELRAAFELVYYYPPTSQYFFVNGCLANDDSTMEELNVGTNSLFVLFLLKHLTGTKRN